MIGCLAMASEGPLAFVRALRSRRPLAVGAAIALVVVVVGTGVALAGLASGGATRSPIPSEIGLATLGPSPFAPETPTPEPTATPSPTPSPTPEPTPAMVAATTDGVLLPAGEADLATRHPIAVMIDDQAGARPQSGLSQADIVYQAPAEGGIPRYMAIFQTQDPPSIGPIRSSRLYYVAWAEEWRALYVHMSGAPNAMAYLYQINGTYVWNADGLHYGGKSGYMWRVTYKAAPHNLYSSAAKLRALADKLGATAPFTKSPWTFADAAPTQNRPIGGTIVVPYQANRVVYNYDRATNTYPRSVTGQAVETDAGNGQPIAPSNVVVLYEPMGALSGSANIHKGRLEVGYNGTGKAVVFNDGTAIDARWSKKNDSSPTLLSYASGPLAGQPVPLVRGQIFVQVVPTEMAVTWTLGRTVPPKIQ